ARAFFMIADQIEVIGPSYLPIDVLVFVELDAGADPALIRHQAEERIAELLLPLGSALRPEGWNFGATIYASSVAAVLGDIPGVRLLRGLSFAGDRSTVTLVENELPTAGQVTLEVNDGG